MSKKISVSVGGEALEYVRAYATRRGFTLDAAVDKMLGIAQSRLGAVGRHAEKQEKQAKAKKARPKAAKVAKKTKKKKTATDEAKVKVPRGARAKRPPAEVVQIPVPVEVEVSA